MNQQKTNARVMKYVSGLGTHGVGTLIALATQVFFARVMGPADYGLLALTLAVVLLPADLASLGVEPSTARFLAVNTGAGRFDRIGAIIWQSAVFMAIDGLLLTVALLLLRPHLARWFSMPGLNSSLFVLVLFVPLIYLLKWSYMVLKGLGYVTTQIVLESSVFQILNLCFGAGLWFTYNSVEAVVFGYGLAYATVAMLGLGYVGSLIWRQSIMKNAGSFDFQEIVLHGLPLNITALAQRLLRRGDTFVIGALLGANSLGVYRAAYMLASGVKQFITPINTYALFQMSKHFGQKRMADIFSHYNLAVLFSLTLVLPVYLFIFLFAKDLVIWIFDNDYAGAVPLVQVLVIGFSVFVTVGPMGALFNAIGKNWLRMWMVLGVSVLNICFNILFIKWFGLVGAAIGTSISFAVLYGLFLFCMRTDLISGLESFMPLFLVILMGVLALGLKFLVFPQTGESLVLIAPAIVALFICCVLVTFRYYQRTVDRRRGDESSETIKEGKTE